MADPKTHERCQEAISEIEIENFELAQDLKKIAQKYRVSSLVANISTGKKVLLGASNGGEGRRRSIAELHDRWRFVYDDTNAKFPNRNNSEIARILLKKELEQDPSFETIRKAVSGWRKASK
jgi:hypothetical protein